jgi:threonine 3-dehydrogenase
VKIAPFRNRAFLRALRVQHAAPTLQLGLRKSLHRGTAGTGGRQPGRIPPRTAGLYRSPRACGAAQGHRRPALGAGAGRCRHARRAGRRNLPGGARPAGTGDEVVVLTPAYDALVNLFEHIVGCERVRKWRFRAERGRWVLRFEDLQELVSARTRLLVVNFPHNPTGFLPSPALQRQIVDLAEGLGAWLFSDEMYYGLVHAGTPAIPSAAELSSRAVVLSGLSKTHGLPGLRCGWLLLRDPALRERVMNWKYYTSICPAVPTEALALAALMKALVKREAGKGIWLEDVPEPTIGINDVLIKVKRTAICGTDVHIYNWDDWAQKTIPVPMVVGHEFVGEIVEVGSNVNDFHPGQIVSGEGHVVCGRCRNCMAGRRHLCAHTSGRRRQPSRRLRRVHRCRCPTSGSTTNRHRPRRGGHLRPVRQRRAHGAAVRPARRGRADHRRRPDRLHGGGGMPPRRRAPRRHHRPQPGRLELAKPMGATRTVDVTRETSRRAARAGHERRLRRRLEMSGNPQAFRDMLATCATAARSRCSASPREDRHRLEHGDLQHADDQGHLRPRDVRDLVQDVGDDRVGLDISPVITHRLPYTAGIPAWASMP